MKTELNVEEVKIERIFIKNLTAIRTSFSIGAKRLVASSPKIKFRDGDFLWDPENTEKIKPNKFGMIQKALLLKDQPHTKQKEIVRPGYILNLT